MKYRTTTKYIKENYPKIISVGYGQLQTLLRNHNAVAYTSGCYGWAYDVYDIDGVAICTGNYGFPTKLSKNAKKYEETARRFLENYEYIEDYVFEIMKINNVIEHILSEFIKNELSI